MNVEEIGTFAKTLREQIARVVVGQDDAVTLILTALLAEGHVLLEGVPGTGKTLLARTFSQLLSLKFNRIQFTPDLMPADLIGSNLFNFQTSEFTLTKGPIFTEVLLADEINRTPPKTQAALLECMQERRVTLDGKTYQLSDGFMVLATQNPIEQEGTYPLPEAQLDRFLFRIIIDHPSRDDERAIVKLHGHQTSMPDPKAMGLTSVATIEDIRAARETISNIELSDPMIDYIVDLVRATRTDPNLMTGASSRAANMLATGSRSLAALSGRQYVVPDDVKFLIGATIAHRLILTPGAEIEGLRATDILHRILERTEAPK